MSIKGKWLSMYINKLGTSVEILVTIALVSKQLVWSHDTLRSGAFFLITPIEELLYGVYFSTEAYLVKYVNLLYQ